MTTSVKDLARFAMLQFRDGLAGGSQILRGSTLQEMQRIHWLEPDWLAGWGLGFRIERKEEKTFVRHGGSVRGYRTELTICPDDKIAIIVFTNADDGKPIVYAEAGYRWVAPALLETASPEHEPAVADPDWQSYVGKYRSAWADLQVLVLDGELVALDPSEPDPLLGRSKLIPVSEHAFRIETNDGYGDHGELAVFEIDQAGQIQRIKFGANYVYPAAAW
jgi:hypothetical protein